MNFYIVCFGELYVGPFPDLTSAMEWADRQEGDYVLKAVTGPTNPEYDFK